MDAIRVDQLTKSFEDTVAVDRISFSVPEGELFGLPGLVRPWHYDPLLLVDHRAGRLFF
jgi:hypothetical protein